VALTCGWARTVGQSADCKLRIPLYRIFGWITAPPDAEASRVMRQ
jgi:hypothetical protein